VQADVGGAEGRPAQVAVLPQLFSSQRVGGLARTTAATCG
jgi:hypothetical protein